MPPAQWLIPKDIFSFIFPISVVIFGAGVMTTKKMQFQTKAIGKGPPASCFKEHAFRKPVIQVAQQMLSEIFSLIVFALLFVYDYYKKTKYAKENPESPEREEKDCLIKPAGDTEELPENGGSNIFAKYYYKLKTQYIPMLLLRTFIPAVLYVGCAVSASFAVSSLSPPSLMECLTTSVIIFQPIWQIIFLKKSFSILQFTALFIALCGVILASASAFFGAQAFTPENTKEVGLGVFLMLFAQCLASLQYVTEEIFFIKRKYDASLTLGIEGVYGLVLTIILLAILQKIEVKKPPYFFGYAENTRDSWVQISNSRRLKVLIVLYMTFTFCFMYSGIQTTRRFTSVHRVLLAATKAFAVWIIQLIMYKATDGKEGEKWGKYSWMQLIGYILLLAGDIMFQIVSLRREYQYEALKKEKQYVKLGEDDDENVKPNENGKASVKTYNGNVNSNEF